jgi:hypothetical protein
VFLVPFIGALLVLEKEHYMADIVMAVITARWIEYEMPLRKSEATENEDGDAVRGEE